MPLQKIAVAEERVEVKRARLIDLNILAVLKEEEMIKDKRRKIYDTI